VNSVISVIDAEAALSMLPVRWLFVVQTPQRAFVLSVSYFEIYNEKLTDLLDPSQKNVEIRQDKVFIFNISFGIKVKMY